MPILANTHDVVKSFLNARLSHKLNLTFSTAYGKIFLDFAGQNHLPFKKEKRTYYKRFIHKIAFAERRKKTISARTVSVDEGRQLSKDSADAAAA